MTNEAFAQRIVQMQETLYRVSYSLLPQQYDREDAVQECIRKAWQKRATLRDDRYMQTWVIRILLNECYALQRKRARETPVDSLPERAAPEDADLLLHDVFLSLDDKLRTVAVLFYIEDYEVKEIARMLRLPAGTVKSRLHRARALLRERTAASGSRAARTTHGRRNRREGSV